jgi:hypothetical protein
MVMRRSQNRPFIRRCAQVREAEEVTRLRSPETTSPPSPGGVAPELDEPSLVGVQLQPELREPLAEIGKEPQRLLGVFEAHDEVVRPTHDDHNPVRVAASPPVCPQVENVMKVDVGEQR